MKRVPFVSILFMLLTMVLPAQELVTAVQYFDQISQSYGNITDYQAEVVIDQGGDTMEGLIYYKSPNQIRIDFSDPSEQVLVSDGAILKLYVPRLNVTFVQDLPRRSQATLDIMASNQSLRLMRNNYSIAYLTGPEQVPLEEDGSGEMVTKLQLFRRNTNEAYRQLVISIGSNGFIRRIDGTTANYREVRFDFINLQVNQGILDSRFEFEDPPSANQINNFLFDPEG